MIAWSLGSASLLSFVVWYQTYLSDVVVDAGVTGGQVVLAA